MDNEATRWVWLYKRGPESIRIVRARDGHDLWICGPGRAEHTHTFEAVLVLTDFMRAFDAQLQADGWTLSATVDRRLEHRLMPEGDDRRRDALVLVRDVTKSTSTN